MKNGITGDDMNIFSRKELSFKINVAFVFFIACFTFAIAQGPDTLWTKTFGGADNDYGYLVQQTADSGYIIIGKTRSLGAGKEDVYLIKTDRNGDTLWTKTYGDTANDAGLSIQQTTDQGYIISGYTYSYGAGLADAYLIKTDSLGDTLWTRVYGKSFWEWGHSVQQTYDNGYIIAGFTYNPGVSWEEVYLIKTDSLGDTLWTKEYGGIDDEWAYAVEQTSDSGYIVVGYVTSWGTGGFDLWLIKTDSNGDTLWTKTFGGADNDYGYSVQQTLAGGYIIVGNTHSFGAGNFDVWLIKTDSSGDTLWTKTFGGTEYERGSSVQQTSNDNGYIIGGYTNSYGAGGYDIWLIRTNANGDTLWTRTYGDTAHDFCRSIELTHDRAYIIAGNTNSSGAGNYDVYVMKTEPDYSNIKENKMTQISKLNLEIYPNPFCEKVNIRFQIHKKSSVEMKMSGYR